MSLDVIVESTAHVEDGNNSPMKRAHHTLTTELIVKECVKQGFYRNPVCNDKLYLHGKGYTDVDASAFEPYTDVKVLWLEGNALSSLPCGGSLIQVQPPRRRTYLTSSDDEDEEGEKGSAEATDNSQSDAIPAAVHVDPSADTMAAAAAAPSTTKKQRRKKKVEAAASEFPSADAVPADLRDGFSSLYPTVRQLYLHNNMFREMPDLSRFECLDAVNFANNFITSVNPCCPHWETWAAKHAADNDETEEVEATEETAEAESDSKEESNKALMAIPPSGPNEANVAAAVRRAAELEALKEDIASAASRCQHESLHPDTVCPTEKAQRTFCTSLRTLNLAANHVDSIDGVRGLLCFKSLISLDLSQNRIEDGEGLLLILEKLPHLRSLKLSGNPLVRTLTRYRKQVLARCPTLLHLDDRPVFAEERRLINAWAAGGDKAELSERDLIRKENEDSQRRRLDEFRSFLNQHRSAVPAPSSGGAEPRRRHRDPTRPGSDPDDSPTSSEEEDDEDNTAQQGAPTFGEEVIRTRANNASATTTADDAVENDDMEDVFVPQ